MPNSAQRSLVKPFEPSSCAAARRGPNALMPARGKIVDEAGDQRRLGADHHETDRLARQKAAIAAWSPGSRATLVPHCAVPGLPGAMKSRSHRELPSELPGERVLAPARADEKDVHGLSRFPARL